VIDFPDLATMEKIAKDPPNAHCVVLHFKGKKVPTPPFWIDHAGILQKLWNLVPEIVKVFALAKSVVHFVQPPCALIMCV
jgi:hypothetical protein